jgi:hypothetical protein
VPSAPETSNFTPVATMSDLATLDRDEVLRGWGEFEIGDPEPGPNHSRSYWHGWRCAAMMTGPAPRES